MPSPLPAMTPIDPERAAIQFANEAVLGSMAMFSPAAGDPQLAVQALRLALDASGRAFSRLKIRPPRHLAQNLARAFAERARDLARQRPGGEWADAWGQGWILATQGFGPQERALAGAELPAWLFTHAQTFEPWTLDQARQAALALLCANPVQPRFDLALACEPPGATLADPAAGASLARSFVDALGWPKIRARALSLWRQGASIDTFGPLRQALPEKLAPETRQACLRASARAADPGADAFGACAMGVFGAAGAPDTSDFAAPSQTLSPEDALALMLGARSDTVAWAAWTLPRLAGATPDLMLAALRKTPTASVATRQSALEACLTMARTLQADPAFPQGCLTPGTRQVAAPARLGANSGEAAWVCALACGESVSRPREAQAARELLSFFTAAGFDLSEGSPSALEKMDKQKITPSWRAFAQSQTIASAAPASPGASPRPRL